MEKQLDLFGFEQEPIGINPSELQKERLKTYNEEHCFQYDIRRRNLSEDLLYSGLTMDDISKIKVSDFSFYIATSDKEKELCKAFIKRHEWLGTIPQYTTHYFYAKYKGIVGGVILMTMPNAFSKFMGDYGKLERLVSRGACISWSPKNLASCFLMWCIKWMVKNTEFRVFSAYSDPMAKELGSIYQACNFYYLGQNFGTTTRCINPFNNKICSDRYFRQRSAFKRYAKLLGIEWKREWFGASEKINWHLIPKDDAERIRKMSREMAAKSEKVTFLPKHKYIYVLGRDKRETNVLRKVLLDNAKIYEYPKERGK